MAKNKDAFICEQIKVIINQRGIKQKVVAQKAGYSQQVFSNLMNGRKLFTAQDILRVAKALDVTPNDLFNLTS